MEMNAKGAEEEEEKDADESRREKKKAPRRKERSRGGVQIVNLTGDDAGDEATRAGRQ